MLLNLCSILAISATALAAQVQLGDVALIGRRIPTLDQEFFGGTFH